MATAAAAAAAAAAIAPGCDKPVYLTFDTGHMGVAPLVAEVLRRQQVAATFFLANEPTLTGGGSLDAQWAPWWKARADEGHAFGSHTWDHDVWRGDARGSDGRIAFRMRPTAGPAAMKPRLLDAEGYCAELERPARRFEEMTGRRMGAIFRAPGGKTSKALLDAAAACGWTHVGWADAGFLGDELPSERFPNAALLARSLRDIRAGDVLLAHLGIRSRKDPWAPAVLEPLIVGLKQRGFCFATLREHPQFGAAAKAARATGAPGASGAASAPGAAGAARAAR
ncbi:MAG: polysaccharide deacetylase family protein [Rubrivivax sp.]|nr:polysaccharide deacetylase family protein [Rubrivivax sp.]